MTTTTRQQRQLERVWVQQASPIPSPRPRRIWLVLAAGIGIGVLLGAGSRWLTLPFASEPAVKRCRFTVPQLSGQDLEPVMPPDLARRWAPGGDLHKHLGPQLPKPAPAQPTPTPDGEDQCVR
jgi:hypothetical protein